MSKGDYFQMALAFAGGLGLFIFGMQTMANGLQKSAGNKMKKLLGILTNNKFLGVLVGAFVTAIIQSSSATTVMVVGFVNAGIMNLSQAAGVIMGANIGTTATAWIVSSVEWAQYMKPTSLAMIAVAVGVILHSVAKKNIIKHTSEILIGFGVLFIGIDMMSGAVAPMSSSPYAKTLFLNLGTNPFLGILAGTLVTGILQSSSASVGILQSLAAASLVPFNAAVYIIMGQNIGTCVTALLSSIGASKSGKSAAYIHLMFNISGTIIFTAFSIIFFNYINPAFGESLINRTEIGVVHTFFNVFSTVILFPFSSILIKISTKMTHLNPTDMVEDEGSLMHLDDRMLETPAFAVENSLKEVVRLGHMVAENVYAASDAILQKDTDKVNKILVREKNIDELTTGLTSYFVKICNININEKQNKTITTLFHTINDMERVGDHCENLAETAMEMIDQKIIFSETAQTALREILSLAADCFENAIHALEYNDVALASKVIKQEDMVDNLEEEFRQAHIARLANRQCSAAAGAVYLDSLTNIERITDHANNIARVVLEEAMLKAKK